MLSLRITGYFMLRFTFPGKFSVSQTPHAHTKDDENEFDVIRRNSFHV